MRFALLALLLLPTLAAAQPQAPPPPQAPPVTFQAVRSYDDAYKTALARRVPLVLFVGGMERPVAGCEVVAVKTLTGYPAACVVVSLPSSDYLAWRATLPATATNADILKEFRPAVQSAAPVPFRFAPRASATSC